MKRKRRTAWLITWDGRDAEHNGRCKVVAILPSQLGDDVVCVLLRVLYHSEAKLTLCEKALPRDAIHKDPWFKQTYRENNPEYWHGMLGSEHLCARKVKGLWCEESHDNVFETTLHWTELPKFKPSQIYGQEGAPDQADDTIEVRGVKDVLYTYSTRPKSKV